MLFIAKPAPSRKANRALTGCLRLVWSTQLRISPGQNSKLHTQPSSSSLHAGVGSIAASHVSCRSEADSFEPLGIKEIGKPQNRFQLFQNILHDFHWPELPETQMSLI